MFTVNGLGYSASRRGPSISPSFGPIPLPPSLTNLLPGLSQPSRGAHLRLSPDPCTLLDLYLLALSRGLVQVRCHETSPLPVGVGHTCGWRSVVRTAPWFLDPASLRPSVLPDMTHNLLWTVTKPTLPLSEPSHALSLSYAPRAGLSVSRSLGQGGADLRLAVALPHSGRV